MDEKKIKLAIMTASAKTLEYMKKNNPQSKVIMTAENSMRAKELYEEGADYVVIPQQMSGKYLAELVNDNGNITNLMKLRNHEK